MAQKDKIKELVGRGLNSYHTKSLQQIDRIEKKNKEQNHKISILSNELDNDYLTKTEEGSVISLEHSKEGMVYLDELQGNTLVNYCTDGSKELTLNGDIDVEGTFITTTEGVDNGKVDVYCEGNTLVNLLPWQFPFSYWVGSGATYWRHLTYKKLNLVDGKTYSIIIKANIQNLNYVRLGHANSLSPSQITVLAKDLNKPIPFVATGIENNDFTIIVNKTGNYEWTKAELDSFSAILLEGDWTNKEIPQYFEGMKSVGQDDENGHKIEILSQNKNLFSGEMVIGSLDVDTGLEMGYTTVPQIRTKDFTRVKPNTTYSVSCDLCPSGVVIHKYDKDYKHLKSDTVSKTVFITDTNCEYVKFRSFNSDSNIVNENAKLLLEEGNIPTDYIAHKSNKKEILLNEPLRGLPNGVKDKKVKIGNKWYIERNCREVVLNGSENWIEANQNDWGSSTIYGVYLRDLDNFKAGSYVISDKFPSLGRVVNVTGITNEYITGISGSHTFCILGIKMDKLSSNSVSSFKTWLQSNPIKVVYELATPIYEPLEIEPTLNTYTDITHISNNSIIPCNMKIKNSGYNAIIKPSTLYTVALDTNKSGTIGMNLGGAKVTTTNNVATITTPATLTDDSLRLYGKGINGSKVRLLEGDKTNWIPSHFEGMKSSFEDKVQEDGTYKMEILSNNENLLILEKEPYFWRNSNKSIATRRDDKIIINGLVNQGWDAINLGYSSLLKSDTKYTITCKINQNMNVNHGVVLRYKHNGIIVSTSNYLWSGGNVNISKYTFTTPRISFDTIEVGYMVTWDGDKLTQTYTNLEFSEIGINEVYNPNKSNKIQFSSIEPLRGLANGVRDRLCIKDNKLMIERNCGKVVLDGDTTKASYDGGIQPNEKYHNIIIKINNDKSAMKSFNEKYKCIAIDKMPYLLHAYPNVQGFGMNQYVDPSATFVGCIPASILGDRSKAQYFKDNPTTIIYNLAEPTYEEIPFELQKIILEGYENGTLFFDTNIPPTSTITYAGETPIVKSVKLNKTEVLNNTNDINDNIIPYLMDMDYRVVCLQLQSEEFNDGVSMARLFGGAYEMLKRDIQSKRYSVDEYKHRLDAYLDANKITEEEYNKLGDMLNE